MKESLGLALRKKSIRPGDVPVKAFVHGGPCNIINAFGFQVFGRERDHGLRAGIFRPPDRPFFPGPYRHIKVSAVYL